MILLLGEGQGATVSGEDTLTKVWVKGMYRQKILASG